MRQSLLLLATAVASTTASIIQYAPDTLIAALLPRQAPGTPEYDCHANCGTIPLCSYPGVHEKTD